MMASDPTNLAREQLDLSAETPVEYLDVADLGPPDPLRRTLETLPTLDDDAVLVQSNDRVPQHLFPKLADRGYEYEVLRDDEDVVTAIWLE